MVSARQGPSSPSGMSLEFSAGLFHGSPGKAPRKILSLQVQGHSQLTPGTCCAPPGVSPLLWRLCQAQISVPQVCEHIPASSTDSRLQTHLDSAAPELISKLAAGSDNAPTPSHNTQWSKSWGNHTHSPRKAAGFAAFGAVALQVSSWLLCLFVFSVDSLAAPAGLFPC